MLPSPTFFMYIYPPPPPSGSAIGVASKLNNPYIDSYTENIVFYLHVRNILSVISACYISQHQLAMGKSVGKLARPALKYFFHVCTAFSALLVQCIWGVVY